MPNQGPSNDQREFRCIHCNGKILIPKDLPPTTGPCPHCKQTITSPAPEKPGPARVAVEVPVPAVVREVSAPAPQPGPAVAPGMGGAVPPRHSIPASPQQGRPVPVPEPQAIPAGREIKAAVAESPPGPSATPGEPAKKNAARRRNALLAPVLIALSLVLVAGGVLMFLSKFLEHRTSIPLPPVTGGSRASDEGHRPDGWREEASEVLRSFLAAQTSAGKAAWSLRSAELLPEMEAFYGGAKIDDSDTPVSAFSAIELPPEDSRRGIFMMVYDLPPQFELREFFRPLAPLEVQYGLERADMLLASMAQVSNFESEPLKVHAFLKPTPEGLRIDWETFVQTKYRTFRNFIELPEAGRSRIFRVFIHEDVPEKGRAPAGTRTYRVIDPAHTGDLVRVNVPVDSELGRALSILNWRGVKDAKPKSRTATVELEWSQEETPRILLKRFICWEFLGIGGQAVETGR